MMRRSESVEANLARKLHRHRVGVLTLGLVQNCLGAGIFYGWSALEALLIDPSINAFGELCVTSHDNKPHYGCNDQNKKLHWIYTIAQSANLFGSLVSGLVLDYFGPRICNVVSLIGVVLGMLLLAISAHPQFDFEGYLPAMVLIGFWGPGVQVSLFHLSNLFPNNTSSVTAMISGTFQLGFTIFLLFKFLTENLGIPLSYTCAGYAVLLMGMTVLGLFVWPDRPVARKADLSSVQNGIQENLLADDHADNDESENEDTQLIMDEFNGVSSPSIMSTLRDLFQPICSLKFLLLLYWMVMCTFWANYFIGTVTDQFATYYGQDVAKEYVDLFNLLLILGTLSIPLYGSFTDKLGLGPAFILATGCGIVFGIGNLLFSVVKVQVQVATFCVYGLFRTFLFSSVFAYIAAEFGFRFFGAISGILFLLSSLVGLSQYSIVRYFDANYFNLSILQLVCLCSAMVFPIYVSIQQYRATMMRKSIVAIYEVVPAFSPKTEN
jgi:MFS family permease